MLYDWVLKCWIFLLSDDSLQIRVICFTELKFVAHLDKFYTARFCYILLMCLVCVFCINIVWLMCNICLYIVYTNQVMG